LEYQALRIDNNWVNISHWGMIVDYDGIAIKGGIKEEVRRGMVSGYDYVETWGLIETGDGLTEKGLPLYDCLGFYGEKGAVYGTIGAPQCNNDNVKPFGAKEKRIYEKRLQDARDKEEEEYYNPRRKYHDVDYDEEVY